MLVKCGAGFIAYRGELQELERSSGKTVCSVQGTYYNRAISEKYDANATVFANLMQAINPLLKNSCVGFVEEEHDDRAVTECARRC